MDLVYGTGNVPEEQLVRYDDFVEGVRERLQPAYDLVRKHLGHAAVRNKKYYYVHVRPAKY